MPYGLPNPAANQRARRRGFGTGRDLSTASLTTFLLPTADIGESAWTVFGSGEAIWDRLNDVSGNPATSAVASVSDEDVTGAYGNTADDPLLCALAGTLEDDDYGVTVLLRAYVRLADEAIFTHVASPLVRIGTDIVAGTPENISVYTYTTITWLLEQNPVTEAPWTPADVNALGIGLQLEENYAYPLRVSTLEAEVTFTRPAYRYPIYWT